MNTGPKLSKKDEELKRSILIFHKALDIHRIFFLIFMVIISILIGFGFWKMIFDNS